MNPDDEDSGWTNVDEPPEEGYYEEDYEQKAEDYFEAENTQAQKGLVQQGSDVQFTNADGNVMSMVQLRGNVTAALSLTDGFAASVIEKTGEWKLGADGIETTISSSYDLELIKKKETIIRDELTKISGKPMAFKVELQEKKPEVQDNQTPAQVPDQVNILLNAFKGTVVAGKV